MSIVERGTSIITKKQLKEIVDQLPDDECGLTFEDEQGLSLSIDSLAGFDDGTHIACILKQEVCSKRKWYSLRRK